MNLETRVLPELWDSVRLSVEARNYTAAILDSIHLLSDVIRERSGLEGDGVQLVGAAFGGRSPVLKVNRFQSESERNVQKGVEALLRGVYQAIRNPRSHGKHTDEERDCVAIILLVDYLLRIVGESRSPFLLSACVERVLDRDFVPKKEYAEPIATEIPTNKLLGACLEVFRCCGSADGAKVRFFFDAAFSRMTAEDRNEFFAAVSEELRVTNDEQTIRFVLSACSMRWSMLHDVAKLRVEHKLIVSVNEGRWDFNRERCAAGALGTWITGVLDQLSLADDLRTALVNKLYSDDVDEHEYVFRFFGSRIPRLFEKPNPMLTGAVKRGLRAGYGRFKDIVETWGASFYEDESEPDIWTATFAKEVASFVEACPTAATEDDVPF